MSLARAAFDAASRYLRRHPEEIGRAVRGAFGLRFGVPMAAFHWLADELLNKGDAKVAIDAAPPGLRLAGIFDAMDTKLDAKATIIIDRVRITADELRIDVRLEDIDVKILSDKKTQISALIRSGALDVSRPGDLMRELPDIPEFIVDCDGNRIGVDLAKHPQLRSNDAVRKAIATVASLVTIDSIQTDDSHFEVKLRALPRGVVVAAG